VAYIAWTRITRRRGERFVLLLCVFGGSLYPLLTALTRSPLPLPFFAAINGVFQAGINLVFFDILLHTCPAGEQARYIGINQTTTYVATFVSPIVGTYLSQAYSIEAGLLLSSTLSLVGACLFYFLRVGRRSYDEPAPVVGGP
jgi:MFS family permease